MSQPTRTSRKVQTGSSHLKRKFLFNKTEQNIDIPDGDVVTGKKAYDQDCLGCHSLTKNYLAPALGNMFAKTAGTMIGFNYYTQKCKRLGYKWSKQRLFHMLDDPESVFGVESGMTLVGIKDPYRRASIIEYMCYLRMTGDHKVQDHWIK